MTALGVLCCFAMFVCLTLLASFFLPSHLSLKHVYTCTICGNYLYNMYEKTGYQTCDTCVDQAYYPLSMKEKGVHGNIV